VQIRGLRGFCKKSFKRVFSPIAWVASGKFNLNQVSILSELLRRSSSAVGANKVQVKDLSCAKGVNKMRRIKYDITYFIWKRNEHEGRTRPNMKMIWIQLKGRFAIFAPAWWYFQLHILIPNVLLLIVHSERMLMSEERLRTWTDYNNTLPPSSSAFG